MLSAFFSVIFSTGIIENMLIWFSIVMHHKEFAYALSVQILNLSLEVFWLLQRAAQNGV